MILSILVNSVRFLTSFQKWESLDFPNKVFHQITIPQSFQHTFKVLTPYQKKNVGIFKIGLSENVSVILADHHIISVWSHFTSFKYAGFTSGLICCLNILLYYEWIKLLLCASSGRVVNSRQNVEFSVAKSFIWHEFTWLKKGFRFFIFKGCLTTTYILILKRLKTKNMHHKDVK